MRVYFVLLAEYICVVRTTPYLTHQEKNVLGQLQDTQGGARYADEDESQDHHRSQSTPALRTHRDLNQPNHICVSRGGGGPTWVDDFGNRRKNPEELDLGNKRMLSLLQNCALRPKLLPKKVTHKHLAKRKEEMHAVSSFLLLLSVSNHTLLFTTGLPGGD